MLNMQRAPTQNLGDFMPHFGADFMHNFGAEAAGNEDAAGYLSQIPGEIGEHFAPYKRMLDPTALMSEFGKGYHQSPGFQFALKNALAASGHAAAAGGMAGSPQEQQEAAETATGLADQDFGSYLDRALRTYMAGAGGYGRAGEDIASGLMSQANLQKLQQEEDERRKEQQQQALWSGIGQIGGSILSLGQFL